MTEKRAKKEPATENFHEAELREQTTAEQGEQPAEPAAAAAGGQQEALSEFGDVMLEWDKERAELLDRIKRKQADLDNLRRIGKKEQEEAREYALFEFLSRLLPVLDNFERALDAARSDQDLPASHSEGLEMILRQLEQILTQEGVSVIEAEGIPFDPHCHHAVMEVVSEENEPGTITEELQKGYRHRQRILRPSMVKVCR